MPNCPNCGDALQPVAGNSQTPPWGCFVNCARGWWEAELTPQARAVWNSVTRSFMGPTARQIVEAARAERDERVQAARAAAAAQAGRN